MAEINKSLMKVLQINQQEKAVTPSCETCGGPHSYNDCPATVDQTQNVYAAGAYQGGNSYQPQGNLNLLSYSSDNYLGPPGNSINTFEQMAKMFLGKYFPPSMVTKLRNEITNFRQHPDESLFEVWERYKLLVDHCPNYNLLPITQIDIFYNGLTLRHRNTINAAAGGTFMKRRPEECYDLIENMNAHHNDWDTSVQRSESSSSITSSSDPKNVALKAKMAKINKNLMKVLQINHQVKAVTPSCETSTGPHSYNDCPTTVSQT
nr:reverse transcriptase domain-containing protein [Tanacetum cinerariifolium]